MDVVTDGAPSLLDVIPDGAQDPAVALDRSFGLRPQDDKKAVVLSVGKVPASRLDRSFGLRPQDDKKVVVLSAGKKLSS